MRKSSSKNHLYFNDQSCQVLLCKPYSSSHSLLLLCLQVVRTRQRIPFLHHALLSPLTRSLSLVALGLHFLLQDTLTLLLGFGLVNLLPTIISTL